MAKVEMETLVTKARIYSLEIGDQWWRWREITDSQYILGKVLTDLLINLESKKNRGKRWFLGFWFEQLQGWRCHLVKWEYSGCEKKSIRENKCQNPNFE